MSQQREVVAGRYRLINLIGSGGMGHVWLAWDERLSRAVALKQLRPLVDLPDAEAAVAHERVMREARITARLHHPNAVPVFDVVDHDGAPSLVMQYIPSQNLHELLATDGTLPARQVAGIGAGIAAALATAHASGIVHRDVKPANILITHDGTPLLTDFGISRAYGDASLTSTGMLTGTPAYLAPEVARGAASTPASDVFSLGSTLYAAVEGSPPFGVADNPMALLHHVASGTIEPPRHAGSLARVLVWMLAGSPEQRPTMEQAARALEAVAAGAGETVPLEAARPPAVTAAPEAATALAEEHVGETVMLPVEPAAGTRPAPGPAPGPTPGPESAAAAPSTNGLAPAPAHTPKPGRAPAADRPRRRAWPVLLAGALAVAVALLTLFVVNRAEDVPEVVAPAPSRSATAPTGSPTTPRGERPPSTTAPSPKVSTQTAAPPAAAPATSPGPTAATSTQASITPPPSEAPKGAPTGAELSGALRDYYSLLPSDTDSGWARLTERYRTTTSISRQYYEQFWGAIASVRTSDVSASSPSSVVATLRYVYKDGRTYIERVAFRLARQSGQLKIDRSTVLSSRRL